MAKLIKCKICGDTEFTEVGELLQCRSCKHKTPKPKENAELLERANNLRFETKSFDWIFFGGAYSGVGCIHAPNA